MRLTLQNLWDGSPARPDEHVQLDVTLEPEHLTLHIDAPLHADPAPDTPPGPTWALWEHEVVELFILGPDDHYTEVEIGPHGHHLVLQLQGTRNITARQLPLDLTVARSDPRWTATARLQRALLPPRPWRFNAYAIHGVAPHRRYLAFAPVPGEGPDFHRLNGFPDWIT